VVAGEEAEGESEDARDDDAESAGSVAEDVPWARKRALVAIWRRGACKCAPCLGISYAETVAVVMRSESASDAANGESAMAGTAG
jgi:hypothetical protein